MAETFGCGHLKTQENKKPVGKSFACRICSRAAVRESNYRTKHGECLPTTADGITQWWKERGHG